eukprot:TRINITY_DN7706_c0_g1_i1.p1 TRINITY_DN7706_c0_g1~~TRINITY_DN7706_c0_g1_i1.p1  ORF type:complete len:549 (+),score=161.83 TRINITY_DN7706_c0_g1_i1:150-1649(+)
MALFPAVLAAARALEATACECEFTMTVGGEALSSTGDTFAVHDPSNETQIAAAPEATPEDATKALDVAARAGPIWAASTLEERRDALFAWGDAIVQNAARIAAVLCKEQGKPLAAAVDETLRTALWLRLYASFDVPAKVLQETDEMRLELHHRPLGVVVALAPWNVPVTMAVTKIAPAVICGNTVVLKPSEYTPLSTLLLGAASRGCFPPGVVNVVSGHGAVGAALVASPLTAKVTFTGSTQTGKRILAETAKGMKRVTLEAGGNDAAIVRADADIVEVAPKVLGASLRNSGQVCMAVKRVYVHRSIYEQFCDEVARVSRTLAFAPGFQDGAQFGPLNNAAQLRIVTDLVEDARSRGAVIMSGGQRMDRAGYFYPSTVIKDLPAGCRVVDEEQFGPVLPILPFDDDEQAVRLANASPHGLGGSVWTADLDVGARMAGQLRCGTAWVNTHLQIVPGTPFGGFKQSGIGREFSNDAMLASFTEQQVVQVRRVPTKAMGSPI